MTEQDAREMGQEMTGGMGETEGAGTAGEISTGGDEEVFGAGVADEQIGDPVEESPGIGADESGLASGGLDDEEASPT